MSRVKSFLKVLMFGLISIWAFSFLIFVGFPLYYTINLGVIGTASGLGAFIALIIYQRM